LQEHLYFLIEPTVVEKLPTGGAKYYQFKSENPRRKIVMLFLGMEFLDN